MADPVAGFSLAFSIFTFILLFAYISGEKVWFKSFSWRLFRRSSISESELERFIFLLCDTLMKLSKKKVGLLVVIEKHDNLQKYINLGFQVKSKFFPEFLYNIFLNKESSMHDGGVIIRGLEILSVSSYFPINSDRNIPKEFGSRHRAAIGISSRTDAIALLVSESSGKIMYAQAGKITELNKDNIAVLSKELSKLLEFYVK
ncbi:hypothetical protein MHLP_02295 [Candidatus Mycoplasma haematolamae str. Purdue]|uniref:DAC domain-containing protein n=1 Tax=Mycoplasma haematolamae (strain Purdue) TaxID=1212765 RepID=I7CJK6_MYCHA|nr:diadenylate cyclase CdaM [Candidatus Mycoplasma haematolamae]AFO52039.1 hypothetical protein MHLP_02295 [Candidatus Mycoplasma haematolamae str. Purdue]